MAVQATVDVGHAQVREERMAAMAFTRCSVGHSFLAGDLWCP